MDALLWALLKNEVNKSNEEITEALSKKADLVDGKVPAEQLPDGDSGKISFRIAIVNTDNIYTAYAEDGMTWEDWCSSDYNVMYDSNGNIIPDSKNAWQYSSVTNEVYIDNMVLLTKVTRDDNYLYPYIVDGLLYYTYYNHNE